MEGEEPILVRREVVPKVIIKSSVLKKTAAGREDPEQADGETTHTHSQTY